MHVVVDDSQEKSVHKIHFNRIRFFVVLIMMGTFTAATRFDTHCFGFRVGKTKNTEKKKKKIKKFVMC